MTDEARVLSVLRARPSWPRQELDALAAKVAARGRLGAAVARAEARTTATNTQFSSVSSPMIVPANVPPYFSHLDNWHATFYTFLQEELLAELGESSSPHGAD